MPCRLARSIPGSCHPALRQSLRTIFLCAGWVSLRTWRNCCYSCAAVPVATFRDLKFISTADNGSSTTWYRVQPSESVYIGNYIDSGLQMFRVATMAFRGQPARYAELEAGGYCFVRL